MDELKHSRQQDALKPDPCPFCNGAAKLCVLPDSEGYRGWLAVSCTVCGGTYLHVEEVLDRETLEDFSLEDQAAAVAGWNRRSRPPRVIEPEFVFGYPVRDIIVFADICRRNEIAEKDLRRFVMNADAAFRSGFDEVERTIKEQMADYLARGNLDEGFTVEVGFRGGKAPPKEDSHG